MVANMVIMEPFCFFVWASLSHTLCLLFPKKERRVVCTELVVLTAGYLYAME